jgi:translation initiation factor 1A
MPKKKSKHRNTADRSNEEIVFKEKDQYYAQVTKNLGSGRFDITCDDGIQRIGKLRGNMRKSQWVTVGNVVLVSLRDFGDSSSNKADILLKYSDAAVKQLKRYGELNWIAENRNVVDDDNDDEDGIVFEDDGEIDITLL